MSFSHIWSRLRDCYSNNGRSIDRAYGYFQEINNLYSSVVGDATVQRIIFTNVFIERPEHRDMLVASATVKGVFYAVLTLQRSDIFQIERSTIINERVNWCEESFIFSVTDREQIVKNIFNFTAASSAGDDDDSEDEDVMHLEEIAQNEEVLEPPIYSKITEIETHPLLTEELETSTTNFTEDSDEEEIIENSGSFLLDSIGLEVGLRESSVHDNFKKKSSIFFRSMNTSSRCWSREVYRHFFSAFYQETKRIPRSDVFRGPLSDFI